jgi:hypothetical protein
VEQPRAAVSALPVTGHSVADPAGQLKIVYPHGALFENIEIPLAHISSVHAHSPKQTTTGCSVSLACPFVH